MHISIASLFKQYIRQYALMGIFFLLFEGIFALILYLYRITLEVFVYAFVLCLFFGLIICIIHFYQYCQKYRKLSEVKENLPIFPNKFPDSSSQIELLYQEMLWNLQKIRTEEITSQQAKTQDMLDYYSTWAHQIKIPISVMRLILQLEDTKEHKELSNELFRIEQYVEMVLSYIRLDESSSDFIFQEHSLDSIIRQSIRKYAPSFIRKKLRLSYAGTDQIVLTDEKWLSFIIEQLLSNASKYTDQGEIKIEVDQHQVLTITDTGIGIASEDLPRIFERGFTGYNGHSEKTSTGIGLYLCKRAADKLCCSIQISSVVGKGTTVSLDLYKSPLVPE